MCVCRLATLSRACSRVRKTVTFQSRAGGGSGQGYGGNKPTKTEKEAANKVEGSEADNGEQDLETILKWGTDV